MLASIFTSQDEELGLTEVELPFELLQDRYTIAFRPTFNLTGLNPSTAVIFGSSAADDTGQIFLDGNLIGACGGYNAPAPFSASTGFLPTINTLDFVVQDLGGSISGLIVPDIGGHADKVPAPGAAALLCLGGLAAPRRRRA